MSRTKTLHLKDNRLAGITHGTDYYEPGMTQQDRTDKTRSAEIKERTRGRQGSYSRRSGTEIIPHPRCSGTTIVPTNCLERT